MQSEWELETMTYAELKEFLELNEVDVKSIQGTGRTPRPLKSDLLKAAREVRTERSTGATPLSTVEMSEMTNSRVVSAGDGDISKTLSGAVHASKGMANPTFVSEADMDNANTISSAVDASKRMKNPRYASAGVDIAKTWSSTVDVSKGMTTPTRRNPRISMIDLGPSMNPKESESVLLMARQPAQPEDVVDCNYISTTPVASTPISGSSRRQTMEGKSRKSNSFVFNTPTTLQTKPELVKSAGSDQESARILIASAVKRLDMDGDDAPQSMSAGNHQRKSSSSGWIHPSLKLKSEPNVSGSTRVVDAEGTSTPPGHVADEVIGTDTEDEPPSGDECDRDVIYGQDWSMYTIPGLKKKLDEVGVEYSARSKKSELVALLRANQIRMEAHADDADEGPTELQNQVQPTPRRSITNLMCIIIICLILWISLWKYCSIYGSPLRRSFCDTSVQEDLRKRVSPGLRCRPCPAHGICGYGRLVICLDGYVPHRGISCVVDRRLARMVDTMFRRVSFELHRRAGDVLCGFRKDIWMSRTGLIQFLDGQPLLRGLSPSQLEILIEAMMDRLGQYPVVFQVGEEADQWKVRSRTPKKSLLCQLGILLLRNIREIVIVFIASIITIRALMWILRRRMIAIKTSEAYAVVVDLLQHQKRLYSTNEETDPFMVETHLRDEVLPDERPDVKKTIWNAVSKRMSRDSRMLRLGPKTVYGVPAYTWEWRGSLRNRRSSIGVSPMSGIPRSP